MSGVMNVGVMNVGQSICLTVVQVFLIAHFCPYFQASFNAIWPELFNFEHWGGKCVRK